MKWLRWLRYLVPTEEDPAFKAELRRLSVTGLRAIAWVCIGATGLMALVGLATVHDVEAGIFVLADVMVVGIGVAGLALSYWKGVGRWALLLGCSVGVAVATTGIATVLHPAHETFFPGQAMAHVPTTIAIVLLVGMASLPLRPLQMLATGLLIGTAFLFLTHAMDRWDVLSGYSGLHVANMVVIILICTGLTAVVYHRRAEAYRARRMAEESFEELRQAQVRLLVSENAASQRRLAAALSHDLNTPLGALTSAFDTVAQLYRRKGKEPDPGERLDGVFEEATRSGRQSSERLKAAVERMRRLTALDRSEEQVVDLNELWSDTVSFLGTELDAKADVRLDLTPLPLVRCRPQQLSAVFSNLLRNAAAAITEQGRIEITSNQRGGELVFRVSDNGRGIPAQRLSRLFEPEFQVEGSRIATTNWGLFVSRGIIAQHGGHLEIDSREGEGTIATISLPVTLEGAGAAPTGR